MIKEICLEEARQICNSYFNEAIINSGLRSFSFSVSSKVKILEKKEIIVAILVYRRITQEIKEIDFIATREEYGRLGAAQELLNSLEGEELWLELKESNMRALNFYKKNSFILVRRREAYYKDGSAALNMLRK